MKHFILITQFLTSIPINIELKVNRDDFQKAISYFPFVGLTIGIINSLLFLITSNFLPFRVAVIFAIVTQIILTGGIHLDGLSDTFDGLLSGREKNRILEIMKDSRIGTFGLLALVILLLLKFELLASLSKVQIILCIILAPVVARGFIVMSMYKKPYAREHEGMGDLFIGKATKFQYIFNISISSILVILCLGIKAIPILLIVACFIYSFNKWVIKKIGGITGDILGAEIELIDLVFILLLLIFKGSLIWSFI